MKFGITGAAGYIGSTLCEYLLDRGHQVVAVDNFRLGNHAALMRCHSRPGFWFERLDVRDADAVARAVADCDAVLPLAAVVGAPACDRNPGEAQQVNADAVAGLMKRLGRGQAVLVTMTNSGYGAQPGRECYESDPLTPLSLYGRTKCAAEKAVLDRGGVSVRLATVFGLSPRMRFDLLANEFAARLTHEGRIVLYEPHFRRNFVHVRDVARGLLHLAETAAGGVFNFGLPTANLTKWQLAERACRVAGLDPGAAVSVGGGEDPDKRDYVVNNDRVLATGFRFEHDLDDGLREVVSYCRAVTPGEIAAMRN